MYIFEDLSFNFKRLVLENSICITLHKYKEYFEVYALYFNSQFPKQNNVIYMYVNTAVQAATFRNNPPSLFQT